jgi:hypothetical protein
MVPITDDDEDADFLEVLRWCISQRPRKFIDWRWNSLYEATRYIWDMVDLPKFWDKARLSHSKDGVKLALVDRAFSRESFWEDGAREVSDCRISVDWATGPNVVFALGSWPQGPILSTSCSRDGEAVCSLAAGARFPRPHYVLHV